MANLVHIKDVVLYTGNASAVDAVQEVMCKQILDAANIPYTHLHYTDASAHKANQDALSTWAFGPAGKRHTFTKFPIVHWTEQYDNWERFVEVAMGNESLSNSNLLTHADKVVRNG